MKRSKVSEKDSFAAKNDFLRVKQFYHNYAAVTKHVQIQHAISNG